MAWWPAEHGGAGQEGSSLTSLRDTSKLSSINKFGWGMSTMTEFCRGADIEIHALSQGVT